MSIRTVLASAIAVTALAASLAGPASALPAPTPECPAGAKDYVVGMRGSYTPTRIEAGSSLPARVDEGRFRVFNFGASCDVLGQSLDGDFTGIRIGDLVVDGRRPTRFERGVESGEYVFTGEARMRTKTDYWSGLGGVLTPVRYEITVRDIDGRRPSDGGAPGDSFTLKLFDVDDPSEVLLVVEAAMWGHKVRSTEFCTGLVCGGAAGIPTADN